MLELREGEFLEVITLNKSLDDVDYNNWLKQQSKHGYMLKLDDPNYEDSSTYYDRYRRLIHVVSHKRSLIHYYGCVEKKEKLIDPEQFSENYRKNK